MHGDSIEARVGAIGVQVDKLEQRMEDSFKVVDKRFEQVDKRFEQVDKRFEQIDKRFEQVDKRFEQFEERFDRRFESLAEDLREHRRNTMKGFESIDRRLNTLSDNQEVTNQLIAKGAVTMTGGFMAGFAGLIALVATQL